MTSIRDIVGDARTLTLARKRPASRAPLRRGLARAGERGATSAARVQPALRVGAANDPAEREAEATAERVATMPAPAAAPPPTLRGEDPGEAAPARRAVPDQSSQPDTDAFESAPPIPAEQQDPEVPKTEDVDTAGLNQGEFGEIEAGEPDDPGGGDVQLAADAAAVGAEGGAAPADVARTVAQPGTGRPLPQALRTFMEPRFGVGFADVRVHDQPEDRRAANRIGARAFTHRQHIWLGVGERVDDRRLMAHELTHVVQQTRREPHPAAGPAQADARRAAEPQLRRGWIANKAEKVARNVPGYFLMEVILGKSPITDELIPMTAENLVGGFMSLIPGGNLIFERLQETRALTDAFDWVRTRLAELDITWSRVTRLVSDFLDEMPSTSPIADAKRIFRPLVDDIITFVGEITDKILEFIIHGALKLAGPFGERVWGVIQQAREAITLILNDPLGFAKNLIGAVVGGFRKFGANVWKHLKAGLMGWLFGTLQEMNITLPDKLDFKGILSVALQIVGLTYANFRKILVKELGKGGEQKVAYLEKSVEVVAILLKEGFVGIWQRVVEAIDGFKATVIDGIRDFVITNIVKGAISWIAGLSNPVGAIIKVALSIYNMIQAFLERIDQILALANAIFSSIAAIAKGQLTEAIDFIETTIAKAIPPFLGFVAALIPVTGITNAIQGIIKKLQAPVTNAITKLVRLLVKKAKKLFSKVLGRINRKRALPRAGFVIGDKSHELVPEKKGNAFVLTIASDEPMPADAAQAQMKGEAKKASEFGDDSPCVAAFAKAFQLEVDEAEAALKAVTPEQQQASTKGPAEKAAKETDDAGKKLGKLGPCIADNPFLEDKPTDGAIVRAREPRIPEVEGKADLYTNRGAATRQAIKAVVDKARLGARGEQKLSNYYENDHIPEKSLAFVVQEYIQGDLKTEIAEGERDGAPVPDPNLGEIDTRVPGKKGEQLPTISVYRPIHRQKTADTDRNHAGIINAAKAKASPLDKIQTLRQGIATEIKRELDGIAAYYGADKAATPEIRANVKQGFKDLDGLNKTLYGFELGKVPKVKGGKEAAEGSDLPMEGDKASGLPDFADLEGAKVVYKAKPESVGNYLEYDHIVEASLAEKARHLTLADDAFRGGLNEQVKARAAQVAGGAGGAEGTAESGDAPSGEDRGKASAAAPGKGASADAVAKRAMERLYALKTPAFAGTVQAYDRQAAGTVALYRPVHRDVTAKQKGIRGALLTVEDLTAARAKLIDFAVSNPLDTALRDAAVGELRKVVRKKFEDEIASHVDHIREAYQIELKEFLALNRSKQAAAKMSKVIERVAASLRELRSESLTLLS